MKLTLPIDSAERKGVPVYTGCLMYFPAALAGVAAHSKAGNDKHNPGQELHHSRGKSNDHADCVVRHVMDIGDMLAYIEREREHMSNPEYVELVKALLAEANANSWRSLALSQELHERFGGAPLAPRARVESAPDAHELYRASVLAEPQPPNYAAERAGGPPLKGMPTNAQQYCRHPVCITVVDRPHEYCNTHRPVSI